MDVIGTTNGSTPTPGTTPLVLSIPETERNGMLKRPKYPHVVVGCGGDAVYKECLKNHAASSGGHALDGCGEFMPARTATATDPTSLKCAACGCHRNFHRREKLSPTAAAAAATTRLIEYHPQHRHHPPPPPPVLPTPTSPGSDDDQSPPPISSAYYPTSAPHMLLALSDNAKINTASAAAADNNNNNNGICQQPQQHQQHQQQQQQQQMFSSVSPHLSSRKRFRTKFSPDQKERMQEFAEKLGWKMQKSTDELVKGFCNDIGVQREVFKVWMHNNKNTFGRRSASNYVISATNQPGLNNNVNPIKEDYENLNENGIGIGVGNSHSSSINNSNCISDHHQQQHFNNGMTLHSNAAPTNASSSSS